MKFVLGLFFLIVTISGFQRQFNCSVDHQTDGAEMDWDRAGLDWGKYFRWNGKVPYFFDNSVTRKDRALIRKQMDVVQQKTCVRFKSVSQHLAPEHRLKIISHNIGSCRHGFGGGVGYGGRSMEVVFESTYKLADHSSCKNHPLYTGGILHELMHALGAIHTHQRMDRDKHIYYKEDCVKPGKKSQFTKMNFNFPSNDLPYEYNSIMHYGCDTMSICTGKRYCSQECPTLFPKNGKCSEVGLHHPTVNDWKMINQYQCTGNGPNVEETTTEKSYPIDPWYCGSDTSACYWYGCYCPKLCRC